MNAVYIREYGESWCDATIQGLLKRLGEGEGILSGEKNLSHGDSSHYMVWPKDL